MRSLSNDQAGPLAYTIKQATAVATTGVLCWDVAALSLSFQLLCSVIFFLRERM